MRANGRRFVCAAKDLKPCMVIDGPIGALSVLSVAPLDGALEVQGLTADSVRPYRFMTNPEDSYRAREVVGDVIDSGIAGSTRLPHVVVARDAVSAMKAAEGAVKVFEAEAARRMQIVRAIESARS